MRNEIYSSHLHKKNRRNVIELKLPVAPGLSVQPERKVPYVWQIIYLWKDCLKKKKKEWKKGDGHENVKENNQKYLSAPDALKWVIPLTQADVVFSTSNHFQSCHSKIGTDKHGEDGVDEQKSESSQTHETRKMWSKHRSLMRLKQHWKKELVVWQ